MSYVKYININKQNYFREDNAFMENLHQVRFRKQYT